MWAVILKVLHLGLHTNTVVAFFAMIFRIFSSLKNLSRKLIVLLVFLFLGVS
jgi:hypothetical protein